MVWQKAALERERIHERELLHTLECLGLVRSDLECCNLHVSPFSCCSKYTKRARLQLEAGS